MGSEMCIRDRSLAEPIGEVSHGVEVSGIGASVSECAAQTSPTVVPSSVEPAAEPLLVTMPASDTSVPEVVVLSSPELPEPSIEGIAEPAPALPTHTASANAPAVDVLEATGTLLVFTVSTIFSSECSLY